MSFRDTSFLACALLLLASCASPSPDVRRIEHPDRPIERYGFALYPPSNGDWSMAENPEKDRTELLLIKDYDGKRKDKIVLTTVIAVHVANASEETFSKHFKDQHDALDQFSKDAAQPSSGRFKDLASETTWGQFNGQEFVRVSRRVEERDNPIDPSAVLTLETRSTWIFHPDRPTTSMWVMFSQRSPAGQAMPPLAELEDDFFSKLAFE